MLRINEVWDLKKNDNKLVLQNPRQKNQSCLNSYASCNTSFVVQSPETRQYGSHMITTSVNKETKYKYLNIDTRFSDNLNDLKSANYTIMLPDRLTNVKSMTVTNVEVFLSYFNISSSKNNNTFRITDISSGIHTTIVIPDGQYTSDLLQSTINNILPSGINYQIDSQGHSIFSVVDSCSAQYFEFYTDSRGGYDKNNPKFKLGWMMGYRNVAYPIASGKSLISESLVNLNGPQYLYLVIDEFQNGENDTFVSFLSTSLINKRIIARIAVSEYDYLFGSIVDANLKNGLLVSDTRSYGDGIVDIQQLNVQLVDETGAIVDLNGDDISFCLRLEYD